MIELFKEIATEIKERDKKFVDIAFSLPDIKQTVEMVSRFAESCVDEEEKEFVDFCFRMKLNELEQDA